MSELNVKPLNDRLLIKVLIEDETTSGGIILTDAVRGDSPKAEVVAVGTGVVQENGDVRPLIVKVGDTVIFNKSQGIPVRYEGIDYKVITESDILFII